MSHISLFSFYAGLTERQQQVLQLVSIGLTNYEIGDRLCITPSVVAGHLTNIYEEFQTVWDKEPDRRPRRSVVIRYFAPFFDAHPELLELVD